ncbi:MAG: archease [Thermodesulfobacteriota bacterium]
MGGYELTDHTADLGAVFHGRSLEDLFASAGLALFELMVDRPPGPVGEEIEVKVEGADVGDLLVRFLSELLYLFQVRELVVADIRIGEVSPTRLAAMLLVLPFDPTVHGAGREIKAATYHDLLVEQTSEGWRARVVFDL